MNTYVGPLSVPRHHIMNTGSLKLLIWRILIDVVARLVGGIALLRLLGV